ncbi:hypothetical protein PHLGIDRAFT_517526, partial [Phlebiopsis gigantea 11061_1 CR5-6]
MLFENTVSAARDLACSSNACSNASVYLSQSAARTSCSPSVATSPRMRGLSPNLTRGMMSGVSHVEMQKASAYMPADTRHSISPRELRTLICDSSSARTSCFVSPDFHSRSAAVHFDFSKVVFVGTSVVPSPSTTWLRMESRYSPKSSLKATSGQVCVVCSWMSETNDLARRASPRCQHRRGPQPASSKATNDCAHTRTGTNTRSSRVHSTARPSAAHAATSSISPTDVWIPFFSRPYCTVQSLGEARATDAPSSASAAVSRRDTRACSTSARASSSCDPSRNGSGSRLNRK